MTKQERQELKDMLEEKRDELRREVKEKRRSIASVGTMGEIRRIGDFADDANMATEQEIELALLEMKAKIVEVYDQALARLEKDKYGYCSACGEPIAFKRLKALPFAIRCKDCEEADENESARLAKQRHSYTPSFFLADEKNIE